jgi:hypothetical protein
MEVAALVEIIVLSYLWCLHDQIFSIFTDTDRIDLPIHLDFLRDKNTFSEDVISDNLGTDYARNYFTCMNTDPDSEISHILCFKILAKFTNEI